METQKGANLGIGECVFSRAFTPAAAQRLAVDLPRRFDVAAWLLTMTKWPTANGANDTYAFVLVNNQGDVSILNPGGAPRAGTPLSPGQSDSVILAADREAVTIDARGVDNTLGADGSATIEIEIHALYATPKCPQPIKPDCSLPPERRTC